MINHHASADVTLNPAVSAHKATRWHLNTMLLSLQVFFFAFSDGFKMQLFDPRLLL